MRQRSSDGVIENNAIFCHSYLSLSERENRDYPVSAGDQWFPPKIINFCRRFLSLKTDSVKNGLC
jgi:hypothetical protein